MHVLLSNDLPHTTHLLAPLARNPSAMEFRHFFSLAFLFFSCTVTLSAAASPAPVINIVQPNTEHNITSPFNLTLPQSLK